MILLVNTKGLNCLNHEVLKEPTLEDIIETCKISGANDFIDKLLEIKVGGRKKQRYW